MATRLHWRKHYCGDFLGRVACWPLDAIGCYALLMDLIYLNGPMADAEFDAHLSRTSQSGQALIRSVLTRGSDGWTHHRIEEDREHSAHISEIRRMARLGGNNCDTSEPQESHNCAHLAHKTVDVDVVASVSASDSEIPHAKKIAWTQHGRFTGITTEDRDGWAIAYPAVDIDRQLASMHEWLLSNPRKARKSNWRKFVSDWLSRQQDRGGDVPSNRPTAFQPRAPETTAEKTARIKADSAAQIARLEEGRQRGTAPVRDREPSPGWAFGRPEPKAPQNAS